MSDYANTEGLIIEIEASAGEAASELEVLTEKLNDFKSAISNSRSFTTFSSNFDRLMSAVSKMNGDAANKMTAIRDLAEGINMMNGVKLSGTIIAKIAKIGEAANTLNPSSVSTLKMMGEAMALFSQLKGFTFPRSFATNLERIAVLADEIQDADFTKLRELVNSLIPLSQLATVDSAAMNDLARSMNNFSRASRTANTRGRTFNSVMANIRVKTLATIYALRKVVSVITESLDVYGDYIETLNLFSVSMGSAAGKAFEYAQTVQDALGIDMTQWMKSQGVFMTLAKGFGIATDRAAVMSQQLTQLAYDISSFYNISVEDAVQKVQSAFSGELEPVRRLGFDLSQAKLQAIALSLGIDESVKSMDQAEKGSLRYYALLTQVTDAQGDLARTLESPTNQLRIFSAQINQLVRSLGMVFIPVLNKVLPYLNAVARVLKWIIDEIAALFGYTLPGVDWSGVTTGVEEGIGGIEEEIEDTTGAAEKLKNTLASFDEINLIGSKSGGTGKGKVETPGGGGFDFELPTYDFLGEATENRAKAIAETIKKHITPAVEFLKDAIMYIRDNWDKILSITKVLIGLIAGVKLISKLNSVLETLKKIDKVSLGLSLAIGGITFAFKGGSDVANGDMLWGVIETILGAAVAGFGGFLAFGPAGAVIGVMVAITAAVIGFNIEKQKQFEQAVQELYFAVEEGKKPLSEWVETWQAFAQGYIDGFEEISSNSEAMTETKNNIGSLVTSMDDLQRSFDTGNIDIYTFGDEMSRIVKEMSENISHYMDNAHEAISTKLNGAFGQALIKAGFATTEIERMMNLTDSEVKKQIDAAQKNMDDLNSMLRSGLIGQEEYRKGVAQVQEQFKAFAETTNVATEAVQNFDINSKVGYNIESADEVITAINKIRSVYEEATHSLDKESRTVIDGLRTYAQNATGEDKILAENALDFAITYYDGQMTELKTRYADTLLEMENEGMGRWSKVLDEKGLDAAVFAYDENLSKIHDGVKNALKAEGIDYDTSPFARIFTAMDESIEALKTTTGDDTISHQVGKFFMDSAAPLLHFLNIPVDFYGEHQGEVRETLDAMVKLYMEHGDKITQTFEGLRPEIEESLGGIPFNIYGENGAYNYISYFKDTIPSGMDESVDLAVGTLEEREEDFKHQGQLFGESVVSNYNAAIDPTQIGLTTSLMTNAIEEKLRESGGEIDEITASWLTIICGNLDDPNNLVPIATAQLADEAYDALNDKTDEIGNTANSWIEELVTIIENDNTGIDAAEQWVTDINDAMNLKTGIFEGTGTTIKDTIIDAANTKGTNSFTGFGSNIVGFVGTGINDNLDSLKDPARGITDELSDELNANLEGLTPYGTDLLDVIGGSIGNNLDALDKSVDMIGESIYVNLVESLSAMEDYGYNVVISVSKGLENGGAREKVLNATKVLKNTIKGEFTSMSNDIEKTVNDMLKRLANQFNQFQIKAEFNTKAPNLNQSNVPGYASGGFPTSGELFVANENGVAEYIGSMGGKTAVANNTEIIQGVSDGVYKALRETGLVQDVKALTKKKSDVVFAPSKEAGRVMQQSANLYNGAGGRY